jgi:hypothetical protein
MTGDSASFNAQLLNTSDGSVRDVSEQAVWTSSSLAVLGINRGMAVARAPGQATIQATAGGVTGTWAVWIHEAGTFFTPTLVIEALSVDVSRDPVPGRYGYLVRFRLRETGGQTGATVDDILVSGPGESAWTGAGCWRDQLRVPPGGTLSVFETDEGLRWLLYCAPGSGGTSASPTLHVTVYVTDDNGRGGSVEADVTVK